MSVRFDLFDRPEIFIQIKEIIHHQNTFKFIPQKDLKALFHDRVITSLIHELARSRSVNGIDQAMNRNGRNNEEAVRSPENPHRRRLLTILPCNPRLDRQPPGRALSIKNRTLLIKDVSYSDVMQYCRKWWVRRACLRIPESSVVRGGTRQPHRVPSTFQNPGKKSGYAIDELPTQCRTARTPPNRTCVHT